MASLVFELEKYSACSCPACWDPALGIEILNPASECEAWQHAAVEWLWASSIGDVCPGTPLRPRPRMVWCPPTAPRMYQPVNMLSEEIWLMIFFYTSEDFPLLSFSALLELSAVSRMPAKALSAVRAEYLRLLTVSLEVEKQIEMEIDEDIRFREDADAFYETWSIDSDGNWHDREARRIDEGHHRPFVEIPIYDNSELQLRRLRLALPSSPMFSRPVFPASRPVARSPTEAENTDILMNRSPATAVRFPVSPQERDVSPMSVASTIPADFDPLLPASLPFPCYPRSGQLLEDYGLP